MIEWRIFSFVEIVDNKRLGVFAKTGVAPKVQILGPN
jgi:hypothetical protein